jgi:hypothetical protein
MFAARNLCFTFPFDLDNHLIIGVRHDKSYLQSLNEVVCIYVSSYIVAKVRDFVVLSVQFNLEFLLLEIAHRNGSFHCVNYLFVVFVNITVFI